MTHSAPTPAAVRRAVRDVLAHVAAAAHTAPPEHTLTALLTHATETAARRTHRIDPTMPAALLAVWLHGEAACHIVTTAGWPCTGSTDPDLAARLTRLERLPHPTRLSVLRRALTRLDAAPTTPPTLLPSRARQRHLHAVNPGPCGCACTTGQPCGPCGHADCGRRR